MKLISTRSKILTVVDHWRKQYDKYIERDKQDDKYIEQDKQDKRDILKKLEELDLSIVSAKEVDNIIGNCHWTTPPRCSECKCIKSEVIELGEPIDYDSDTVWLCENCVKKALTKFTKKEN